MLLQKYLKISNIFHFLKSFSQTSFKLLQEILCVVFHLNLSLQEFCIIKLILLERGCRRILKLNNLNNKYFRNSITLEVVIFASSFLMLVNLLVYLVIN